MNQKDRLKRKQLTLDTWKQLARVLALVAFILVFVWLVWGKKDNHLSIEANDGINITPEQIQSIRNIGEWEFLSISDEELVDTIRKGLLSDDELVRIYYGTLRLGINLHQAKPGWLKANGDTIVATLPRIGLLDQDFIDEARTRSFHESGRWSAADREALYRKAYRMMLSHCLTPANLRSAENNADTQLRKMLQAMGFHDVTIRFEDE